MHLPFSKANARRRASNSRELPPKSREERRAIGRLPDRCRRPVNEGVGLEAQGLSLEPCALSDVLDSYFETRCVGVRVLSSPLLLLARRLILAGLALLGITLHDEPVEVQALLREALA